MSRSTDPSSPLTSELADQLAEAIWIFRSLELTKRLSIVAATILVYDIISTIDSEIKYVWRSKWTFARVMFHVNRLWAVVLLGIYIPTLFMYGLSEITCIVVSLFYVYGSIFSMTIVTSVLMVRIWLIFGKGRRFLIVIIASWAAITIPSLTVFQISLLRTHFIPNPAPELISACIFTSNKFAFVPYITGLIYETIIFGLTVYKTWRMSRRQMVGPLMARLLRDGSGYYFGVLGAGLFSCVGALSPAIAGAAIGSGSLAAIMSCMCSRLILSSRAFYDDIHEPSACEMHTLSQTGHERRPSRDPRTAIELSPTRTARIEWRAPPECPSSCVLVVEEGPRGPGSGSGWKPGWI